jgi:microsomal dipeptidase-like Zn-dependent dipeptidase
MCFLIDRLDTGNVGIGSDLQAGGKYVPEPLNRSDAFRRIRSGLLERGYPQAVVDGVLGDNP